MELTRKAMALMKDPLHALSLGFGSGLSPWAPGTLGTLAAVPLYYAMSFLPVWAYWAVTAAVILIGIPACERTARALDVHDAGVIVWDEVAGYLIAMGMMPRQWQWLLAGFVLFRLFDIIKPWPIRIIDSKVGGGFGIMLDDIIAGAFTLLVLLAVNQWLIPVR